MNTHNHERCILNSFILAYINEKELNQYKTLSIPYKLFKNRFYAIVGQIIEKLRLKNKPFDELSVETILRDKGFMDEDNYLDILATMPCSYESVKFYIDYIKKQNRRITL